MNGKPTCLAIIVGLSLALGTSSALSAEGKPKRYIVVPPVVGPAFQPQIFPFLNSRFSTEYLTAFGTPGGSPPLTFTTLSGFLSELSVVLTLAPNVARKVPVGKPVPHGSLFFQANHDRIAYTQFPGDDHPTALSLLWTYKLALEKKVGTKLHYEPICGSGLLAHRVIGVGEIGPIVNDSDSGTPFNLILNDGEPTEITNDVRTYALGFLAESKQPHPDDESIEMIYQRVLQYGGTKSIHVLRYVAEMNILVVEDAASGIPAFVGNMNE